MTWNEDAEKWLELARDGHDPDAADTRRVRRALVARGVIVAGGIAGSVATTAGAAASATVKALMVQASAAFIVVGSMATGSALLFGASPNQPSASTPATASVVRTSPAANRANARPASSEAPGVSADEPPASTTSDAASQLQPATTGSGAVRPVQPSSLMARSSEAPLTPALEREIAGLRSAQQALHRGETESAARALNELEATDPGGALLEERLATRTILACSSGNAPVELRQFLERYPTSVHRERVRAACERRPEVGRFPETEPTAGAH
ncbi:MAG TPA: hypothetical protein VI197_28240 [Polyangiaceae bacterium]